VRRVLAAFRGASSRVTIFARSAGSFCIGCRILRTIDSVGAWRYAPRRAADKSAAAAKRRERRTPKRVPPSDDNNLIVNNLRSFFVTKNKFGSLEKRNPFSCSRLPICYTRAQRHLTPRITTVGIFSSRFGNQREKNRFDQ
jgi:predicted Fe-S protein YdhL (DUF1289 family)